MKRSRLTLTLTLMVMIMIMIMILMTYDDRNDLDSIEAVQTFKYITSNLEAESLQEKEAIFTLGIYCLKNNETKIAQYSLKRLLMRDKENVDLRCFLVLAISIDGKINECN